MLAGTTAALLGAVSLASGRSAAADGAQDSALLILCAEFHRTQAVLDEWYATVFELEPHDLNSEAHRLWEVDNKRVYDANYNIFEAISDMPAKTQAGLAAKAKVLTVNMDRVARYKDGSFHEDAEDYAVFAYSLAQEAAQIAGGVA
jgi:hypothetical protein